LSPWQDGDDESERVPTKVIENAASGRLRVREASRLLQLDEELRTPRLPGMEVEELDW
jgi:hypothetical protein